MKNRPLLLALFLHLVILLTSVYFAWSYYQEKLEQASIETQSTLALDVGIKKTLLDKHLTTTETEILFLANTGSLKLALDTLKTAWAELGSTANKTLHTLYIEHNPHITKSKLLHANSDSNYDILHISIHTLLYELQLKRHYQNILLLDMQGNVIYDVRKGKYFASNISNQPKHISKVFSEIKKNPLNEYVSYIDFSPNDGSFFATALSDEEGEKIGILIFKISKEVIDNIAHLTPVDKHTCIENSSKNKLYFVATTCLQYKENYWLIKNKKSVEEIYAPLKKTALKHIAMMFLLGLIALIIGYTILTKFLGRQEEEEDE